MRTTTRCPQPGDTGLRKPDLLRELLLPPSKLGYLVVCINCDNQPDSFYLTIHSDVKLAIEKKPDFAELFPVTCERAYTTNVYNLGSGPSFSSFHDNHCFALTVHEADTSMHFELRSSFTARIGLYLYRSDKMLSEMGMREVGSFLVGDSSSGLKHLRFSFSFTEPGEKYLLVPVSFDGKFVSSGFRRTEKYL